jgi:hypothetical protein
MRPDRPRAADERARAWSGGTSFALFLAANLVLDLAVLGWGAAAYSPPPGGCRLVGCANDRGEWFYVMALITLTPGVLGGAALSSLVHRLLYGSVRLPRPGWVPRLAVMPPLVLGFALLVIFLFGEPNVGTPM